VSLCSWKRNEYHGVDSEIQVMRRGQGNEWDQGNETGAG
jgi:hypothetical protein